MTKSEPPNECRDAYEKWQDAPETQWPIFELITPDLVWAAWKTAWNTRAHSAPHLDGMIKWLEAAKVEWKSSQVQRGFDEAIAIIRQHQFTPMSAEPASNNPGIAGDGESCYYCGEPCDSFAGNPGKWPIILCHRNEPGVPKVHHSACVSARLEPAPLTGEGGAQAINLCPTQIETVNAAIMKAAPQIAALAHAGVMQAIERTPAVESRGLTEEERCALVNEMASEIGIARLGQPYDDFIGEAEAALTALLEKYELRRRP